MRKLPNVFNQTQLHQLLDTINEPWLMIAVLLALFCGLRKSEVCNLRVQDIDLSTKRVHVCNSKNPNRTIEGYGKDRIVPLPVFLEPVLYRWINDFCNGKDYLFPSLKNPLLPVSGEHLWHSYAQTLRRAGLDRVVKTDAKGMPRHQYNFHTLRHTYATLLWERTGDILTVKTALGHSKIETTMIYTHVSNKVIEQKVNEAFTHKTLSVATSQSGNTIVDPVGILMRRLALGEITPETFRSLKQELQRNAQQQNAYIG